MSGSAYLVAHLAPQSFKYSANGVYSAMRSIRSTLLAAGFAVLAGSAIAQDAAPAAPAAAPLTAQLAVAAVTIDKATSKEVLAPAGAAVPGDVLQYSSSYKNVSDQPLGGLVVNGQIPANTAFTAAGLSVSQQATFQVLVEGEDWQGLPAYKTVKHDDGTTERVEATDADYTQIRWQLSGPLPAGATLLTVYRVRVNR